MSQKSPNSSNDRVSPRRRFHRPAAEFLGARRQVPVLTGLPRVESIEQSVSPKREVLQPKPVEDASQTADLTPAEDIVQPATEPATQAALNIREMERESNVTNENDTWREWAYPVAGTLIAGLLVYTAWVGLNKTTTAPTQQVQREQPAQATFNTVQVAKAAATSFVVEPDLPAPPSPPSELSSSPEPSPSSAQSPPSQERSSWALSPPSEPRPSELRRPTVQDSLRGQRSASVPSHVEQPFVEAPIVFPESPSSTRPQPTEFVEHDVAGWEFGSPELATKPDNSWPSTTSPSSPPVEATLEPEVEPEIPFMAAGPVSGAPREEIPGEYTSGEPSEADYPTTEYSDQLPPAPQAAIHHSADFSAAGTQDPLMPGVQQPSNDAGSPNTEQSPIPAATTNDQFVSLDSQQHQPVVMNSPGVETQQAGHVVVNPHFQPRAVESVAAETGNTLSGPALGPKPTMEMPLVAALDVPVKKSIYGTFPSLNAPQKPSIDQVRLNGIIEPFPQTKQ